MSAPACNCITRLEHRGITLCPLHAAAEKMYEALTDCLASGEDADWGRVRAAVAAAEGKEDAK